MPEGNTEESVSKEAIRRPGGKNLKGLTGLFLAGQEKGIPCRLHKKAAGKRLEPGRNVAKLPV